MSISLNILDYNAKPDGKTFVDDAIKHAHRDLRQNGGGTLFFPKGDYRVEYPAYFPSNVIWEGEGDESFVFNDRQVTAKIGDQYCFFIGNFEVISYTQTLHFTPLQYLREGDNKINLSKSDIHHFEVGKIIQIESKEGFIGEGEIPRPYVALLNKITAIINDEIIVENPFPVTIENPSVAPANRFIASAMHGAEDQLNHRWRICQNSGIRNMRFQSNDYVTKRYGCYKCFLENVTFRSTKGIGGNGLAYFTVKDSRFEFSYKAIETAFFSHDTVIDNCSFAFFKNGSIETDVPRPIVRIGENTRDCIFSNLVIDTGESDTGPLISCDHSFNNTIQDSHFIAQNITQCAVDLEAIDEYAKIDSNKISYCNFYMGNTKSYAKITNSSFPTAVVNNNAIEDCNFYGALLNKYSVVLGGSNNKLKGYFENGEVKEESGGVNNQIINV